MITYEKVLELGLKHEPIQNPELYTWIQMDDIAICGERTDTSPELLFEAVTKEYIHKVADIFETRTPTVLISIGIDYLSSENEIALGVHRIIIGDPMRVGACVIDAIDSDLEIKASILDLYRQGE